MSDTMMSFVLMTLLKVSLVLVLARFCATQLASAHASVRHAVLTTSLGVALAIPVLSVLPGGIAVPLGDAAAVSALVDDGGAADAQTEGISASKEAATPSTGSDRPTSRTSMATWILGAYVIVSCSLLLFFGAGLWRVRRVEQRAANLDLHPQWRDAAAVLQRRVQASGARLRVSNEVQAPVTFGAFRPVVLLPGAGQAWTAQERHSALLHELAHIERRDWLSQWTAQVACSLYWFHPLTWMTARQLHLEAELACDDEVVRNGSLPEDYAQQLVDLSRRTRSGQPLAAVALAGRSELAQRVASILNVGRRPMKSQRKLIAVSAGILACGLLLAPLQLTRADARADSMRPRAMASPLMRAAAEGHLDTVLELLDREADPNEKQHSQGTPLILAATFGHFDVVEALLDRGADPNLHERGGRRELQRSALGAAAREGHSRIVELLLDRGARVDTAPRGDATPLMEAAEHGHLDIVQLLLDRGADANRRIRGDGSPLIAAARGNDLEAVRRLVEAGADVNDGVPGDGNALIAAVRNRNRRMVEYLLDQGADPSAYVPGDETALLAAAEMGDRRLLRLLLDFED